MELFEGKNIIIALLLFFSGCIAFQPPEPVEITTPKTITTESTPLLVPHTLLIEINKTGDIVSTYFNEDSSKTRSFIGKKLSLMNDAVNDALKKAGGKENLKIVIDQNISDKSKSFNIVIEALRKSELYSFKILTSPK